MGIFRKEPQGIVEPSDIIHFFLSTLGDDVSRSIITEVIVCHGQQASPKAGSSKNRHQSKPLIGNSLIINDSAPNMHGKPIIALNNQLNKWSPILSHIITQSAPFVYTFFCISQQTSSHRVLSYCCTSVTSSLLGTGHATKSDEFSEKFETALDPPHFRKMIKQFFSENVRKKTFIKVQNLQYKFLD